MKKFVIAITGASGACYAKRLFDILQPKSEVHLIISERGWELLNMEAGLNREYFLKERVVLHKNNRMNSPVASGSFAIDGMAVVPASMGTVGRIASGISGTLIERVADVCMKERVRLVVVPRETPLSGIQLKNLLTLSQEGVVVLPASPGFYNKPQLVEDLVDFVVARILKHLGEDQDLIPSYEPK